jgi:hypothetical protein
MQRKSYFLLMLLYGLIACNDSGRETNSNSSDNDIDAARNFIQAALVGDFERAKVFMVNDSLNNEQFDAIQRLNERQEKGEKEKYQTASIRIHQDRNINDSTSIIYYSNSYKNKIDSLKVVKTGGKWLVDFKYIFHKIDSLP